MGCCLKSDVLQGSPKQLYIDSQPCPTNFMALRVCLSTSQEAAAVLARPRVHPKLMPALSVEDRAGVGTYSSLMEVGHRRQQLEIVPMGPGISELIPRSPLWQALSPSLPCLGASCLGHQSSPYVSVLACAAQLVLACTAVDSWPLEPRHSCSSTCIVLALPSEVGGWLPSCANCATLLLVHGRVRLCSSLVIQVLP